jgi:hypothetical protein
VRAAVVDLLDPGGEEPVELQQISHVTLAGLGGLAGDLDEELVAHGAEEPFDLSPTLRTARGRVGQPDAELGAGSQQPGVNERGPVVHAMPTSA